MGTALFVLLWWLALFGWWIVLVGTNAGPELLAGACAAALAALLALVLRRHGLLSYRLRARRPARVLKVPWRVIYECGVVLGALAMHLAGLRRLNSRYRAFDLPAGGGNSKTGGGPRRP